MKMSNSAKQSLLFAANLSLPTFQVIAVNANLGCAHCRHRVTQIITKMAGSKKFTIDVCIKQVIIKGEVRFDYNGGSSEDFEEKKLQNSSIVSCVLKLLVRSFDFVRTMSHCLKGEINLFN